MNEQIITRGISIIIADDHPMFRKGLSATLKNLPNVKEVAEAKNGSELLRRLRLLSPDVVFLDIIMPIIDGEMAARTIREKYPEMRIIIMSISDDPYIIRRLYLIGCHAYLVKNADETEIQKAINEVLSGRRYFGEHLMEKILTEPDKGNHPDINQKLTASEKKLIPLFCTEKSNKQIAKELFLSVRTVENHRYHIYNKTGAKNLSELIQFVISHGIV